MRRISYPLAALSFGLGALELLSGRKVARRLGLPRSAPVLKTYGLREVASGALLLAAPRSSVGAWSRVAGDVMDLATLGAARLQGRGKRRSMIGAAAFVGAALVADVAAGLLTRRSANRRSRWARSLLAAPA